jgi:hypothetical protein
MIYCEVPWAYCLGYRIRGSKESSRGEYCSGDKARLAFTGLGNMPGIRHSWSVICQQIKQRLLSANQHTKIQYHLIKDEINGDGLPFYWVRSEDGV